MNFIAQEYEPSVGRLLVFSVEGQGTERKINLVAEEETRGSVYVLNGFNGKLLAGINSKVRHMPCNGQSLIFAVASISELAEDDLQQPIIVILHTVNAKSQDLFTSSSRSSCSAGARKTMESKSFRVNMGITGIF